MDDAWAVNMTKRLKSAIPDMTMASGAVQDAARRAARSAAIQGRSATVRVVPTPLGVRVQVSGPGAAAVREQLRKDLAAARPQIRAKIAAQAAQRLRG